MANIVRGVWFVGETGELGPAHRIMPLIHCCSQPRKEGRGQPANSGGPDSGSPSGTRLLRLVSSSVYLWAGGESGKGTRRRFLCMMTRHSLACNTRLHVR